MTIYQPPLEERWNFWCTNILNFVFFDQEKYNLFLKKLKKTRENKKEMMETIKKDVPRTFSTHEFFFIESHNISLGKKSLENVCKVVGSFLKTIGYCQGINFIIGFFLKISGANELQTVNFTLNLMLDTKFLISGFYDDGFPMISFLKFFIKKILEEESFKIYDYIVNKVQIPDDLWLSKWLICLMTTYLPKYHTARLLDFVFSQDIFALGEYIACILDFIQLFLFGKDIDDLNDVFNGLSDEFSFLLPEPSVIAKRVLKKFRKDEKWKLGIIKEFLFDDKSYGKEEFSRGYMPFLSEYLMNGVSRVLSLEEFERQSKGGMGEEEVVRDFDRFFRFKYYDY